MSILEVPGARLYYETHGSGPLMVMIPGAGGAGGIFRMVTEHLAAHYTVVLYDRRGFSRSQLDGTVIELPGGHVGCVAHPAEFARELVRALDSRPAPRLTQR